MAFTLQITKGPGAGQSLRFDQNEVTFGRIEGNDVVLRDPNVSRKHFQIVESGGSYVLRDLGSSNGTLVNGSRVQEHGLADGDQIQAGDAVLVFSGAGARKVPARRERAAAPARQEASAPPARRAASSAARAEPASARERFRQRAAAQTPIGRAKTWFANAPTPKKALVLGSAGVLFLLLILVAIPGGSGGGIAGIGGTDWSGEVLRLEGPVREACFGYDVPDCNQQAKHDVGFSFQYLDGRATLRFDAGWVDTDQEVEIRLNEDTIVGYAPLAINSWVDGNEIILPYDELVQNEINTVVFDNTKNPGKKLHAWAVRAVSITEDPLPNPDPILAEEKHKIAEKQWSEKDIGPNNLWSACKNFSLARDYLEKLDLKPPLYDEASHRAKECHRELNRKYDEILFTVQRFERYRNWEGAKGALELGLKYFPEETDNRNRRLKQMLDQYP